MPPMLCGAVLCCVIWCGAVAVAFAKGNTGPFFLLRRQLATGVGFDDLALWGTAKAGHAAKSGAWNVNYRIPFQRSAKVTLQHWAAPNSTAPQIGYAIVRGAENIPIKVGDLELPGATARLALHKIEDVTYAPLAWVPLIDIPEGDGLVYMTTLAVTSGNLNFLEVSAAMQCTPVWLPECGSLSRSLSLSVCHSQRCWHVVQNKRTLVGVISR